MTSIAAAHTLPRRGVRAQIEANRQSVSAADQGHLHAAINSVSWERRGPLRRLTRRP